MAGERQATGQDLDGSIAMLKQILEVMPDDTMAMKALHEAYCDGGRRDEAFAYLRKLVDLACGEEDAELGKYVADRLIDFEGEFPSEVSVEALRLRSAFSSDGGEESDAGGGGGGAPAQTGETDIAEELSLAWMLYEESLLSQEDYSMILHDLTESSGRELTVPVSVLHVLSDRGLPHINRIMNHISSRSGTPCISLSDFELPDQIETLFPMDVMMHDGALPFAIQGKELLVAVLNPFNAGLAERIERISGRRCHAFLVFPEEYDAALKTLRDRLDG